MQLNANLSKFEQSKHIEANDANISYNKALQPDMKKWHKTRLGGTIQSKTKLTQNDNNDLLKPLTSVQSIQCFQGLIDDPKNTSTQT